MPLSSKHDVATSKASRACLDALCRARLGTPFIGTSEFSSDGNRRATVVFSPGEQTRSMCALIGAMCALIDAVCALIDAVCALIDAVCALIGAVRALIGAVCALIGAVCALPRSVSSFTDAVTAHRRRVVDSSRKIRNQIRSGPRSCRYMRARARRRLASLTRLEAAVDRRKARGAADYPDHQTPRALGSAPSESRCARSGRGRSSWQTCGTLRGQFDVSAAFPALTATETV